MNFQRHAEVVQAVVYRQSIFGARSALSIGNNVFATARLSGGDCGIRISRIKMGQALLPHADKGTRGDLVDAFPGAFECRKRVAPDGAFAPPLALLLAF